jgi:hypothetical protein
MPGELLLINPRKRKAAKKAAPRRAKRRTVKRAAPVVVMANPKRRSARKSRMSHLKTSVKRAGRKYKRNPIAKLSMAGIGGMAKNAALGAAGAIAVDVGFGYVKNMLPVSMQTPTDGAGAMNPLYFVAKGAVAVAAGMLGSKVTKHASTMAAGSLTISAYEILRSFIPTTVTLGYMNPAQMASRRMAPKPAQDMARYVSGPGSKMNGYSAPVNSLYMGEFVS